MNTDGLLSSLSSRGMADLGPVKPKVQKEQGHLDRSPKGLGSFSDVLKGQKAEAPVRKEATRSRETDSKNEAPEVREQTNERVEKPKTKKGRSDREDAMLEFMDSMENEFGIPPARIVEAMAQLPQDELLQSPEETASQVIESLDLPPEQAEQAYSKYIGLLGLLAQAPQVPVSTEMPVAAESLQSRRALLNDSLDRMNQRFFNQDPAPMNTSKPLATEELVDRLSFERSQESFAQKGAEGLAKESLQKAPAVSAKPEFFAGPQQDLSEITKQMQPSQDPTESTQAMMAKLSALGSSAGMLNKAFEQTPTGQTGEAQSQMAGAGLESSGFQLSEAALKAVAGGQGQGGFGQEPSSDSEGELASKQSDAFSPGLHAESLTQDRTHSFKGALAVATPPGAQQTDGNPNLEKLMSQANMIVRKGGGEATVRMTPEGLGEVHMKIVVKDGKVNVEMMAESKEAKKLLESSLGDLKLGLGQHKLSVESVKVDVGNQAATDQQHQQKNPDLSQDQGRNQARQFMQQFRDDNLGRREPFFEMPGVRAYARPSRGPQALQPAEEAQTRMAKGTGERMNLIA